MTDIQETESEYEKRIREYVELTQAMMATGRIESIEHLKQCIFKTCEFLSSIDAYEFITSACTPFDWDDVFSLELLKQYEYNLPVFILYTATVAVGLEVFNRLIATDGYRFLMGDKRTLRVDLPDFPDVVFQEVWKSAADKYKNEDLIETYTINGLLLFVYADTENNGLVYVFQHEDPSLIWIANTEIS